VSSRLLALLAFCIGWGLSQPALAQQRFASNKYAIDLFTGPVLGGGGRVIGMAGAHVAIASGIDGAPYNPAGYAERYEKEINWFAFDITGGLALSGLFTRNDFDNNGKANRASNAAYQVTLGTRMQFSYFGTGLTWQERRYSLTGAETGRKFDLVIDTWRTGAGYSFLNGGLVAGTTLAVYKFAVANQNQQFPITDFSNGKDPIGYTGFGAEFGVLLRPAHERYRAGIVARTPVTLRPDQKDRKDEDGIRRAQGLVLPDGVHVPWEVAWGFAYQFGERRANVPWRNTQNLRRDLAAQIANRTYQAPPRYGESPYQSLPEDPEQALDVAMANYREAERRYRRHQPRRYVLLAADVVMTGKTSNGHGIEAFLDQTPERSGQKISYGVRVGAESEIWPDRMKVRGGTYLEPSRFQRSYYRPHATAGLEARLFDLWRWSVRGTATLDLAPRYVNWGLAFGLWW
jgi:hypothetical protein